jgi:tetratricopeptide (TPR) repeat protein
MIHKVVRCSLTAALFLSLAILPSAHAAGAGSEDYDKASDLMSKKSFAEAITSLDKAIQADPKHGEAYMDRALCNFHLGNYKKTLEDCDAVAKQDSAHEVLKRQAFMMSAGAHNALGEYEAAVQSADKAIALAPKASLCYSDRAFAYKQLHKIDEALRDVNEAIKLDPKHASNYEMRASILEFLAHQDRARYHALIQGRKPGEKPWQHALESKSASADDASKK